MGASGRGRASIANQPCVKAFKVSTRVLHVLRNTKKRPILAEYLRYSHNRQACIARHDVDYAEVGCFCNGDIPCESFDARAINVQIAGFPGDIAFVPPPQPQSTRASTYFISMLDVPPASSHKYACSAAMTALATVPRQIERALEGIQGGRRGRLRKASGIHQEATWAPNSCYAVGTHMNITG